MMLIVMIDMMMMMMMMMYVRGAQYDADADDNI